MQINLDFYNARLELKAIIPFCSPDEIKFLQLKLRGFKGKEISEIMGCSKSKVNCCMQSIKEKVRELQMVNEEQKEEIKKAKKNGELNSVLMHKYKIGYAQLREILDDEPNDKDENQKGE